jgi:Uma2 family endonuclease
MIQTAERAAKKAWTEEELQSLPDDGFNFELIDGELVMSPKNNFQHEHISGELQDALRSFVKSHGAGVVLGGNIGCWMKNRNCRAPDVAFISKERLQKFGFKPNTKKFFPEAPDLAVEVLSPSNTRAEIDARLKDFFSSGSKLVWIIDPEEESVEVCHSPTDRKLIGSGGFLEGEDLLPGFRHPIADLFKQWEWE